MQSCVEEEGELQQLAQRVNSREGRNSPEWQVGNRKDCNWNIIQQQTALVRNGAQAQ